MISRVSGLLMLPSETQSRGRVQQMRQHRSLDKHDRPKGDALMQRQDQDAVREKILKRPGTSTARSPMAPTLWNSGRQRAKCWRSRSQEPDDGVLHRSNRADRVKAVAARSVGARSASLDAGRSMGNPALATTQLLIRSPRRRWRAAGRQGGLGLRLPLGSSCRLFRLGHPQ
jgi:hypothetical protein